MEKNAAKLYVYSCLESQFKKCNISEQLFADSRNVLGHNCIMLKHNERSQRKSSEVLSDNGGYLVQYFVNYLNCRCQFLHVFHSDFDPCCSELIHVGG